MKSRDFDLLAPFGIKEIQPHNTYVGALVELGSFGLIGFLVTLLSGFGAMGSYKSLDGPEKILARGVLISYALVLMNIAFFDAANRYGLWLFLGLMLSIRRNRIPRTEDADFANERLATV